MNGRMSKADNDLFYTCSLIDYIARKTKNKRKTIVNQLGEENIKKIYQLADIYHSDNIETVSDEFIQIAQITKADFDNVKNCKFTVPSHFDIGKVYKRFVKGIAEYENISVIEALFKAYNSYVSDKIDDYNSSFYYDSPQNILNAYIYGYIE